MSAKKLPNAILTRHEPSGIERFEGVWNSHRTAAHAHPEYQLTITLEGVGRMEYLGHSARIPVGTMGLFHPAEPHAIGTVDRKTEWKFRVLHIPPSRLEGVERPLLQPGPLLVDAKLGRILEIVWRESLSSREEAETSRTSDRLERALESLASELALRPGVEFPSRGESRLVRACLSHLAASLEGPLSLGDLSAKTKASPAKIRRAVLAATGLTPQAWHLQRRILEAKHLLARGVSIPETAARTGFSDQAHFSRHFKKLVGVSPARYGHIDDAEP